MDPQILSEVMNAVGHQRRVSTTTMHMHLLGHAVFKSMLFMVVGLLLHSTGMQDSRMLPSCSWRSTSS